MLESGSDLLASTPLTLDPGREPRSGTDPGPERDDGRLRIAIVSEVFLPAIDGVVTRLMRTLEELSRFGDELLMVAPAGGPSEYRGVEVVGMPALRMPLYPDGGGYPPKRVSRPTRQLDQVLRRFAPDIVHAVNPVLLGLSAAASARRQGIPLVASYHAHLPTYAHAYRIGFMESLGWSYLRSVHNRAQLNLCTSLATGAMLTGHGFERVELWPYGIDVERFCPGRASAAWRARLSGGRSGRLVMLYVGRLAKEKAVERLLEAARVDGATLAIVGDGPERPALERAFAGTPTEFLGFLTGDDLADAYASADLFLLPSDTETLGLVTLEAQASGLPVIAAESPAARELVAAHGSGLLFDPGRPGSLATAVRELTRDPGRRADLAAEALRATRGRTWRAATSVLRGHYLECVAAAPAGVALSPRTGTASVALSPTAATAARSPASRPEPSPPDPAPPSALQAALAAAAALLLAAVLMGRIRSVEGIGGLWLLNLLLSLPIAIVAVCVTVLGATAAIDRWPALGTRCSIGRWLSPLLALAGAAAIVPPVAGAALRSLALGEWMRVAAGVVLVSCAVVRAARAAPVVRGAEREPCLGRTEREPRLGRAAAIARRGRAAAARTGGERTADPFGG